MNSAIHYQVPRRGRSARTQALTDPPPYCRMTAITETIGYTIVPAAGGVVMAVNSKADFGVILGGAIAGAGLAGALGAILAGSIKEMEIPRMTGLKRLAVNFLFGLLTVPFISKIHRTWASEEDLGMVSAAVAAGMSLFGVILFSIALPVLLRWARNRVGQYEPQEPRTLITDRPRPLTQADTVRLDPPKKS